MPAGHVRAFEKVWEADKDQMLSSFYIHSLKPPKNIYGSYLARETLLLQ